ncbi:TonB-dependent receptor [Novosphingobium rosa]|uniref:TonB-dependent receptor n=1 Tax=Novosphingobium rosa TaxID=76978 RepID=UPI00082FA320|nr:TonB-dependent receptor [Novosphingobium rosa]
MTSAVRRMLALASVSLMPFVALSAHAGTAPAAPQAEQAAEEAPPAEDPHEVTVYARKRAENAQSVPIPITTLSAGELTRENLVNFTDFQNKFPAFSVYLTNPKQLNLGIRGIGNNGFNTDGIDGSVGIFVDGVYTGRQGMVSNDFNDIADVELLRGPQGTLFGKNTTAGTVIINTLKPSFKPGVTAEANVGNMGLREGKASLTGPLIDGKLAFRLSGYYSEMDGSYKNLYNGQYQNGRQGEGLRGQLLFTPNEKLTVRLIAAWNHQGFNTMSPIVTQIYTPTALQARMAAAGYVLNASNASQRYLNIDAALNARTDSYTGSGTIDYDLGSAGTITSITAWEHWKCWTNNDNDYTQLNAIPDYGSCNNEQQFSQELRWSTPKNRPIEATVGGFLSRQQLAVDSRIRFGDQYYIWAANPSATDFPNINGKSWAQGAYANAVAGVGMNSHAVFHTNTEALFANVSWHPTSDRKLALDGGLRYTWESRSEFYSGVLTSNTGNLNAAQIADMSSAAANAAMGSVNQSLKDNALSGEGTLSYQVTPDVMLYAKYARGYKSAGFNLLPVVDPRIFALGGGQTVKGEQADNFEGGIKSQWFDKHLQINLTAYHTKVSNYQANESVGVGNTALKFLANVGSLTSNGVELESEAWLPKGFHAKGFVAFDHAYYSSFHNSACPAEYTALSCDLTGRQVAWAPKWTADLSLDQTVQLNHNVKGYWLVDANWRTGQNTTITLDPLANIPAYALVNARVGVKLLGDALDVQLWSDNLLNKTYYFNLLGLTKSTGIAQGYPGNPRSFGVRVRASF